MKRKAHAQIAHLVFADTQNVNPKKPKELFFADTHISLKPKEIK